MKSPPAVPRPGRFLQHQNPSACPFCTLYNRGANLLSCPTCSSSSPHRLSNSKMLKQAGREKPGTCSSFLQNTNLHLLPKEKELTFKSPVAFSLEQLRAPFVQRFSRILITYDNAHSLCVCSLPSYFPKPPVNNLFSPAGTWRTETPQVLSHLLLCFTPCSQGFHHLCRSVLKNPWLFLGLKLSLLHCAFN